jgi:hypothetical protein
MRQTLRRFTCKDLGDEPEQWVAFLGGAVDRKEMTMRISLQRVVIPILIIGLAAPSSVVSQGDSLPTLRVEVAPAVAELVQAWDSTIWFFTPSANPIRSLEGLRTSDIACWGAENFQRMKDLFSVLGLEGEGVRVVGVGSHNDVAPPLRLYVTWARYAPHLRGMTRVLLVAKAPADSDR